MVGTFRTLATADAGFDADGVMLAHVSLPEEQNTFERQRIVYDDLLARLHTIPGVERAAAAQITPIGNSRWNERITVDGFEASSPQDAISLINEVSAAYFATLGSRVLAGREFDARDVFGAPPVAVVNAAFAHRFFGSTDVIGRELRVGRAERTYRIIGVVEDAKYESLREEPQPTAYQAWAQADERAFSMSFAIRLRAATQSVVPAITEAVRTADPALTVRLTPFAQQVADSLARERLLAVLSGFFGSVALLLAMIGLYGTMAYSVARRRNEIGIRMALGSAGNRVLRMVLGEAGRMIVLGLIAGAALTYFAARTVSSFVYGMSVTDARTLLLSAALMAAVGFGASALPAWRAARVQPMSALRDE